MINFSMDDPDYHKPGYFDAVFKFRTWLNLIFTIPVFLISIVILVLIIPLFLIGSILVFIWIGVPILNFCFSINYYIIRLLCYINSKLYNKNIPIVNKPVISGPTQLNVFYQQIRDNRTWRYILFDIIGLPFSALGIGISGFFVYFSYLLVITPYKAMFGHIEILGYKTDYFIEATILFFVGLILWVGILNLINYWSELHIKLLRYFASR